ncbi:hypothetical protein EJ05DRAFT_160482 [Pseudovirgaria hyperparasitica]|uniref:Zn(2)-C6 fungal-type domain-containing protein n=1 Tax=Pseudovirgaria hyperparasitica TaxID=470096 RepID=A0A6A6VUU9_9PEZI|nr:uncharacterized protein EJ05DRAFT_160482 [Pseudovirgaria hyperparasitica]KAF2753935.1 hypothetical protein EJ05DRAFT_160482 [Pseudovirgaria hyperparasitica]
MSLAGPQPRPMHPGISSWPGQHAVSSHPRLPGLPSPSESQYEMPHWNPTQRATPTDPAAPAKDTKLQLPGISQILTPPISEAQRPLSHHVPAPAPAPAPASSFHDSATSVHNSPPRHLSSSTLSRQQSLDGRGTPYLGRRSDPDIPIPHDTYFPHQAHLSHAPQLHHQSPRATSVAPHPIHDTSESVHAGVKRRAESVPRAPDFAPRVVCKVYDEHGNEHWKYDNGNTVPAEIDGEAVNPCWGITKAGKPRKRLAQACLTCREKKIKCDPGFPKCAQCTKSQRTCKGGATEQQSSRSQSHRSETSSPLHRAAGTAHSSPGTYPSVVSTNAAPPEWSRPTKMRRTSDHDLAPRQPQGASPPRHEIRWNQSAGNVGYHTGTDPELKHVPTNNSLHSARHVMSENEKADRWLTDPYEISPAVTLELLDHYFTHFNSATYCLFPRDTIVHWVQHNRSKTPQDRMVLYSMLAIGSLFSHIPDRHAYGKELHEIAEYALKTLFSELTLQICHARLLVGMYCFARGETTASWNHCRLALGCISALGFNSEKVICYIADPSDHVYGLDREKLLECRRRTFWSGFLMDRYNGFCGGTKCNINLEDTFVRLPCTEQEYNMKRTQDPPIFDYDLIGTPTELPLSTMAYLVQVSAIWGQVFSMTDRALNKTVNAAYLDYYEHHYNSMYHKLQAWHAQLPHDLRYSPDALTSSIHRDCAGSFLSLHSLYNTAFIRLNRHVRVGALTTQLERNIQASLVHAKQLFNIAHHLQHADSHRIGSPRPSSFSAVPFLGYSLLAAVDVLTAGGSRDTLPGLKRAVEANLACITELSHVWTSADSQRDLVLRRLRKIDDVTYAGSPRALENGDWAVDHALDATYRRDEDAVYSIGSQIAVAMRDFDIRF